VVLENIAVNAHQFVPANAIDVHLLAHVPPVSVVVFMNTRLCDTQYLADIKTTLLYYYYYLHSSNVWMWMLRTSSSLSHSYFHFVNERKIKNHVNYKFFAICLLNEIWFFILDFKIFKNI
jgi:hypothetical protein